jgi:hypothetical protein
MSLSRTARKSSPGGDELIAAPMSWALPVPGAANISNDASPTEKCLFMGPSDGAIQTPTSQEITS